MLFIEYPKCSTCQKAKKWLDEHEITYTDRHIVEQNPSYEELKEWHEKSGLPLKKFFNTSGLLYKEMKLKDRLPEMSGDEQLKLLATNGMLVKRPLIVDGSTVITALKKRNGQSTFYKNKNVVFIKGRAGMEDYYDYNNCQTMWM